MTTNDRQIINNLKNDVLAGKDISFDDALALYEAGASNLSMLVDASDEIRKKFCGDRADLCSIINAKSGMCEQDCSFCAQSAHNSSGAGIYGLKPAGEILKHAKEAQNAGAHRFCVVTSGGGLSDNDLETITEAIRLIKKETSLLRCASTGKLSEQQIKKLVETGLNRYHHNVETARSFYSNVCTTQKYDEKIATIKNAKKYGIQLCVGGIFNLGETVRQRIEMAFEIKELDPDSVPLNFLNPRQGTPMENMPSMDALDAIKIIAAYRFILPRQIIRLAGGRCETLGCLEEKAMRAGVNGLLIGDYLTTKGPGARKDLAKLIKLGYRVN